MAWAGAQVSVACIPGYLSGRYVSPGQRKISKDIWLRFKKRIKEINSGRRNSFQNKILGEEEGMNLEPKLFSSEEQCGSESYP